ncbi:inositol monophosphatase family protein [Devosia ginsengisoli]|uniref:Inositol monophosphatase n=1 Tax=Devosia ginsengisoli TaxID=400770 RepID=A0A5B8LW59_9HYPH|nr:inositol monophosphatase [Devosia ginsengisoli]QDZ12617.1 inositol monophosphatase [Devosia ginsengisoli]
MTPQELRAFALQLAEEAMVTIAGAHASPDQSATKVDAGDWVTPFDKAVETQTRDRIHAQYPGHRVVGEEFGADADAGGDAEITWYLDPIDGTMNFVHGVPWVAFSLAAVDSQGVVAGVVADVYRREIYSASRGGGAYIDARRVNCAAHARIGGGVFLTEWSRQAAWSGMDEYLHAISAEAGATRIMGSCALALALVGVGRATGTVLPGFYNPWDVYAGALIAREGGAVIAGRSGPAGDVPLDGVMAATPGVADKLLKLWSADQ